MLLTYHIDKIYDLHKTCNDIFDTATYLQIYATGEGYERYSLEKPQSGSHRGRLGASQLQCQADLCIVGNMMSLHEDGAWHRSLYTLPAIVLLAAVALSFLGLGFVMPLRALYAREIGASSVEVGLMVTAFLLA